MILTAGQFKSVYKNAGHVIIPDRSYWAPEGVEKDEFLAAVVECYYGVLSGDFLIEKYRDVDLLTWFKYHDCNRKAMLFKVCADAVFALYYSDKVEAEAPAVGYIHFMTGKTMLKKGSGHAINTMIDGDRGPIYIEPQFIQGPMSKPEVKLNKYEQKSIWLVGS